MLKGNLIDFEIEKIVLYIGVLNLVLGGSFAPY
jgi:hypothetical protein